VKLGLIKATVLSLVGMIIFSASRAEGQVTLGEIDSVRVDANGLGYVKFKTPVGGTPPSCTLAFYSNALAFNTNTPGGKSILATALMAKATNAKISASGTGTCDVFSVMESWSFGFIL
jgi:hypothetical protein